MIFRINIEQDNIFFNSGTFPFGMLLKMGTYRNTMYAIIASEDRTDKNQRLKMSGYVDMSNCEQLKELSPSLLLCELKDVLNKAKGCTNMTRYGENIVLEAEQIKTAYNVFGYNNEEELLNCETLETYLKWTIDYILDDYKPLIYNLLTTGENGTIHIGYDKENNQLKFSTDEKSLEKTQTKFTIYEIADLEQKIGINLLSCRKRVTENEEITKSNNRRTV